ncbi:MAG: hypothetical protein KGZ58_00475 [Ignavibacteriales bacterium]|nr:hypothetical protein [Ignavibacteriales bacterium]
MKEKLLLNWKYIFVGFVSTIVIFLLTIRIFPTSISINGLEIKSNEIAQKKTIYESVKEYFGKKKWVNNLSEKNDEFAFIIEGVNGDFMFLFITDESEREVSLYSVTGGRVLKEKYRELSELLCIENFNRGVGSFGIDTANESVTYSNSLRVGNEPLTLNLIDCLVSDNIQQFDSFLPNLKNYIVPNETDSSKETDIKKIPIENFLYLSI